MTANVLPKTRNWVLVIVLLAMTSGSVLARKKPPPAPAVSPTCTDFYQVSNDDWLRAHPPSPTGGSRWSELNALAQQQTLDLLTRTETDADGSAAHSLADLVASGQNPARRTLAVRATAAPLLEKINNVRKSRDLAQVITTLQLAGVPVLFDIAVRRDPATGQAVAMIQPSELGLPGREYYGRSEPALKALTVQYRQALASLLTTAGVLSAKSAEQAGLALALESSLAAAMATPQPTMMSVAAVDKAYPLLRLPDLLKSLAVAPTNISVLQPGYFKTANQLLAKPNISQWQAYLRARLMLALADALPDDPRRAYLTTLGRAPAATPSERLANWIRDDGGDLLDLAYIDTYLGSDRQKQAQDLAEAMRAAMTRAIDRATWLSPEGRAAASRQLSTMRLEIATPVVPIEAGRLVFDRDNLAANLLGIRRWNRARSLLRLQLTDPASAIDQTRPVIGYQAADNRLMVTAAALQPPVFAGPSQASNFGAFGALLGQQMSLALGNFTGSDGVEWNRRTAGLIAQYSTYPSPARGKVDGLRTQRMNAADLSGLELAWGAYRNSTPGETGGDQAFFRAWATLWARQDGAPATTTATIFAPSRWRANGPLANLPAFAQTFACPAGQGMVRNAAEQVALWR